MSAPPATSRQVGFATQVAKLLFAVALAMVLGPRVAAQTAISWSATTSGSWGTSSNWSGGAVPANSLTTNYANFNNATGVTVTTNTAQSIAGIEFGSSAGSYTLSKTSSPNVTLTVGGYGIRNSSANNQTITGANLRITLGAASSWYQNGGGSLTISSSQGSIATTATNTLTLRGTGIGTATISSQISGAGSVTKLDSSTWTLSGTTNNFTGGVIIGSSGGVSGGTLALGASEVLGSNNVTIFGGTLSLGANNETIGSLTLGGGASGTTASITGAGTLTLGGNVTYSATNNPNGATLSSNLNLGSANRTFTIGDSNAAAADLTVSGAIAGSVGLIKAGAGTLAVGNSNTYTGATTITQGTLSTGSVVVSGGASGLGNATTAVVLGNASSAGTLSYTGNTATFTRGFTVNAGGGRVDTVTAGQVLTIATGGVANSGNFTVGGAGNTTISSTISSTGNIVKVDGGTLTLSGNNSYTGTTTITQGTLAASNIVVSGGTSNLGNASSAVMLGNASTSGTLSYTGNTATFTRGFTVNAGGGRVDTATSGQTLTVATGGIANAGTFTVGGAGNTTISSTISGVGNILKTDAGTLTLSGSNTYTGTTTVSQGTLQLTANALSGAAGALGNATSTVTLNDGSTGASDTALLIGTANVTVGRNISVANSGSGNATLGASISSGNATFTGNIALNRATLLNADGASNVTFSTGAISGAGGITKTGTGNVTLSGNNSGYTGNITVSQGALIATQGNALGTGTGNLTVSGGATLGLSGNITAGTGTLLLAGNSTLTNITGTNIWNTGNVTLTGNATISSAAGTLHLGNQANIPAFSPSGDTEPNEVGFITVGGQTLTFSGAGNIVVNDRIRDFAGQTSRTSYDNPPLTLVSSPSTSNPGNVIIDMASSTASVQFYANANSYTGTTTVANGKLILDTISNAGAPHDPTTASFHSINGNLIIGDGNTAITATVQLGSGASANELISHLASVEIKRDGILNVNSQGQSLGALTFTGGGNVTMSTGTLYLNQDVTVTGASGSPAEITGGQLSLQIQRQVGIDAESATRTFTVSSGGNAYDLLIGSTIQAGDLVKAGNGTLKVTGNNTYTGYTQVQNGILLVAAGSDSSYRSGLGAANTTDAQGTYVNVNAGTLTGNATMSGTLQLMGNITVQRERLQIFGTGFTSGNTTLGALNNLSGNNTWGNISEANTLINLAGNATISSTGGTLTIASHIGSTSNNALTFDTASGTTITVSGGINTSSGNATTATVTKTSVGTLVLAGGSNYKGLTDIQSGTVIVQHANGLGSAESGSQVAAQAELQLSNASVSAEALTLNGHGLGNVTATTGTGALHNIAGNNTWGGTISLQSDSSIKTDSGTSLTLGAIQNYDSNHRALTIGGIGNTTINAGVTIGSVTTGNFTYTSPTGNVTTTTISGTGSGGTLNKIDSGLLTFGGGGTSAIDTFTLSAGNVAINSGTTVRTGVFTSVASTTTTINGTLQSYYGSGSNTITGTLAGSGLFQKDGGGTLVVQSSFSAPNLDLTLTGGTLQFLNSTITLDDLTLAGGTLQVVNSTINVDTLTLAGGSLALSSLGNLTANTIYVTANTTLDFGGAPGGTFLSSANLVINSGVTVTVTNWVSVANNASQSTVWYLRNGNSTTGGVLNPGNITLVDSNNLYGTGPLANITFQGYGGMTTTWVSTNGTQPATGWHQNEIRPTPEPATYGAIFLGSCLALVGWRRFRRRSA